MIIREMKKEDNAIVKEIIQNSLESLGLAKPGTAYYDPQLNDLHQYYSNFDDANYWVVEVREEVVGGIGIAPLNKNDKICELQKLYVRTNVQGLGIGKKLMETALSFASEHYNKCYLETTKDLKTACVLYEKFGFALLQEPLPGSEHSAMDAWYLKQLTPRGS